MMQRGVMPSRNTPKWPHHDPVVFQEDTDVRIQTHVTPNLEEEEEEEDNGDIDDVR